MHINLDLVLTAIVMLLGVVSSFITYRVDPLKLPRSVRELLADTQLISAIEQAVSQCVAAGGMDQQAKINFVAKFVEEQLGRVLTPTMAAALVALVEEKLREKGYMKLPAPAKAIGG